MLSLRGVTGETILYNLPALVAQWIERRVSTPCVAGSNPVEGT